MKQSHKFSAFDWIWIGLLILGILGTALRIRQQQKALPELAEYSLVAEWQQVNPRSAGALQKNDLVYTAADEQFGRILDIEIRPATVSVLKNGRLYQGEASPEHLVDVRLHIAYFGVRKDGIFLWQGREPLHIGSEQRLYTERVFLPLKLLFLEEKSDFLSQKSVDFIGKCMFCTKNKLQICENA